MEDFPQKQIIYITYTAPLYHLIYVASRRHKVLLILSIKQAWHLQDINLHGTRTKNTSYGDIHIQYRTKFSNGSFTPDLYFQSQQNVSPSN